MNGAILKWADELGESLRHAAFGGVAGAAIILVYVAIGFIFAGPYPRLFTVLIPLTTVCIAIGAIVRTIRRSSGIGGRILALFGLFLGMWFGWSFALALAWLYFAPDSFHSVFID